MNALDLRRADRTPVELPECRPEWKAVSSGAAAARQPISWRRGLSEIDRHVSRRIRARRIETGLTQHQLAQLIGITFQQLHKYEVSSNRVSAGRLDAIARALGVDVGYFFAGLEGPAARQDDLALEFARACAGIREERHRKAISLLVHLLAGESSR